MTKPAKPPVTDAEPAEGAADAAEPAEPAADSGPDPEAFLAQIEARAHKGAADGFKESMDAWLKDTDLEDNLSDGKGPRPGGAGIELGGRQRGPAPAEPNPSPFRGVVKEAIELAFGKPRPKRT